MYRTKYIIILRSKLLGPEPVGNDGTGERGSDIYKPPKNNGSLARPFPYHRASKKCRYDLHILIRAFVRGRISGDYF
jgi:hypothetical protein